MDISTTKLQLEQLVKEVNLSSPQYQISFNQQKIKRRNMSISGREGQLWIEPTAIGYDIILSGKSLELDMYEFMSDLCHRERDGYKQTNNNRGSIRAPFWKVNDFEFVRKAVYQYAGVKQNQFEHFLLSIGKSEKTAKNYNGAINGTISRWAIEHGLVQDSIIEIDDLFNFQSISRNIRKLDIYIEKNTIGNGMYNAALNAYADYLSENKGTLIEQDISEILLNNDIDETEKASLVNTRIGQGRFRKNLIRYWKGCAITDYKNSQFLVASHIKPWRESSNSERLDVFNGLLLLPNLDIAFDKGYISFTDKGKICISDELEDPKVLGVKKEMKVTLEKSHEVYMGYHRDEVFKR